MKARIVQVLNEDGSAISDLLEKGQPGDCQNYRKGRLLLACPGCGTWHNIGCSDPKRPETWHIVNGTLSDPTTLTLDPSLHCTGCCGWHGHLKNGVFEAC